MILTLPADRGFPFQVVAESKFGYKWAKWITRMELSSERQLQRLLGKPGLQ